MLDTCRKQTPAIGDRVDCLGHIGTIRYMGAVDGHPGLWYGIDWDDETRGKHDGTVKGKTYFQASASTSGSFVRPEKVQFGQSAVTAITSRYGRQDDELSARFTEQQLLSVQQSINAPFLQLVGFDKIANKQSDFHNLRVVNLRLQTVSSSGESNKLKELCPNLTELDISKNLINNWSAIFDICGQLSNLEWLNVSENSLEFPGDLNSHVYPSVRVLICGSLRLTWSDVLKLSRVFPNLEELRVPNNRINGLDVQTEHNFLRLKILDLENNPIGDWREVLKLWPLGYLEQLVLENTGIRSIKFGDGTKISEFVNLKKLILSHNLIDEWESIGELNKLQCLEDLKFLHNPLLEKEHFDICVDLIIARIGTLKVLNGSIIQSDERRGAEYYYLKKYGLEYYALKEDDQKIEFFKRHNRYQELINSHGMPEKSELTVHTKVIKESLIEVQIVYNRKIVIKKLPPSILIQKLIMLVQRLFHLSERPMLTYLSTSQPDIEIILDDECKELGFYSVQNGDQIVVKSS